MFDFIWNLFSFVVAVGLLVTIHEYGHFWVARKLGFKVLKFSIGFGPALWRKKGKDGVEYVLAGIPLGGYVKMLDAREGPVAPHERDREFMSRPVLHRIAVVAAGPVANFLFAIFAFWLVFMIGSYSPRPLIGDIKQDTVAAKAELRSQQEIKRIAGVEIESWSDIQMALFEHLGEKQVDIVVVDELNRESVKRLDLSELDLDDSRPNILESIGLNPYVPKVPAVIHSVLPGSPSDKAGIKQGDEITAINGEPIVDWQHLLEKVRSSQGNSLAISLSREGKEINLRVQPETYIGKDGRTLARIGATTLPEYPPGYLIKKQHGPFESMFLAVKKTGEVTAFIFATLGKIIAGDVSIHALSGPISIAEGAGTTAKFGLVAFLSFLALISVNLGLVNLLPVPVLDGGHLLYYLVEMVKGSPVSAQVQEFGLKIGLVFIMSIMFIAIYNDVLRLQN